MNGGAGPGVSPGVVGCPEHIGKVDSMKWLPPEGLLMEEMDRTLCCKRQKYPCFSSLVSA